MNRNNNNLVYGLGLPNQRLNSLQRFNEGFKKELGYGLNKNYLSNNPLTIFGQGLLDTNLSKPIGQDLVNQNYGAAAVKTGKGVGSLVKGLLGLF